MPPKPPGLLCVANFAPGTGYAWDFLEALFAAAADELAVLGIRTVVAFPSLETVPERLERSRAQCVSLEVALRSPRSLLSLARLIRREEVRVLYLTDRPVWHPCYPLLRLSGVRKIVVHDHTSGTRTRPTGAKLWLKKLSRFVPGASADKVLAVSEYVATRQRVVGLVPEDRIETIWNSIPLPRIDVRARERIAGLLGLEGGRPAILCTARAAPYKGIHILLEAFDRAWRDRAGDGTSGSLPILVYVGDGPEMDHLRQLRDRLASREDVLFTGYRTDAAAIAAGVDFAVVPSLWQEAFGLAVLEPMGHGKPVIASAVGGIPEIVVDGTTGLLVPPGDVDSLTQAIHWMIDHPEEARQMGEHGRERVKTRFDRETQLTRLVATLRGGFV